MICSLLLQDISRPWILNPGSRDVRATPILVDPWKLWWSLASCGNDKDWLSCLHGFVTYLHTICKLYIRTSSYINLSHLVLCSVVLIACSVLCLSLFVQDFNVCLREGLCLSVLFFTFLLSLCSGLGHSRSRTRSHGRSCRASLATKMFCWNLSGHEQNLRLLFHVLDALNFSSEPEPWTDLYTSTQHCIIQQWPPHFFQLGRRLIHRIQRL